METNAARFPFPLPPNSISEQKAKVKAKMKALFAHLGSHSTASATKAIFPIRAVWRRPNCVPSSGIPSVDLAFHCSNSFRFHFPSSAPATYVLSKNSISLFLGEAVFRISSYIKINSLSWV